MGRPRGGRATDHKVPRPDWRGHALHSILGKMETEGTPLPAHKPAFLRRVQIRGYKSIAFCDVTLEPLTVLVGRNASGKSNFLDALGFLADLMERRATEAVNARGGWKSIHPKVGSNPHIQIAVAAYFESYKSKWDAEYSFALEFAEQNQIRVSHESLIFTDCKDRNRVCGYTYYAGKITWLGQEYFENSLFTDEKLPNPEFFTRRRYDRLLVSVIGTQPFLDFAELLRSSSVYDLLPRAIRSFQPSTGSPKLAADGSNLARAIEGLKEIEPETLSRIERYLRLLVPGVVSFKTQEYGDLETVRFGVKSTHSNTVVEFDASSMSDGTIRVLASLVAANQIVLPIGFPGFVAIEEPETALHPAATQALVAALDAATLRTQILLTTHSPDLLDAEEIKPENVRIVQMIDGQTVIGPIDEASVEIVRRNLDTLGGLERNDSLQIDYDDRQRQIALANRV